jgi:hypothetical protein
MIRSGQSSAECRPAQTGLAAAGAGEPAAARAVARGRTTGETRAEIGAGRAAAVVVLAIRTATNGSSLLAAREFLDRLKIP